MQTRMLIAEVFEMAPKPKTIQMSISGRLEREIAVYLYSAIMHNNEKKTSRDCIQQYGEISQTEH